MLNLRHPTAFGPTLLEYAQLAVRAIYREALPIKKAGVAFSHIIPVPAILLDLFGERSLVQHYQEARLMAVIDALNKIVGRDTVRFAAQGTNQTWYMRQERLSPRFTTI